MRACRPATRSAEQPALARAPGPRPWWLAPALLLATTAGAVADENCTFAGTTDYNGRLAITEHATSLQGRIVIDVRLVLDATPLPLIHTHYVMQEISAWRRNGIEQVAVNDRYSFDGHIVRQQWDVYDRAPDGLQAFRVQGKRWGEFRRQHPDFARFWDPGMFGSPWLAEYPRSSAARRPDLDLHQDPSRVRTPLALAFYWLRRLPPRGDVVPLFLPGFKEQKLVDLPIGPTLDPQPAGGSAWVAPIEYPYLNPTRPSTARAWTSTDRHVLRLAFDLHGVEHSARGVVHVEQCKDTPPD